jgi:hypothetical protein
MPCHQRIATNPNPYALQTHSIEMAFLTHIEEKYPSKFQF